MKFNQLFKGGLAVAMAVTLVACGSNGSTTSQSTGGETAGNSTAAIKIGGSGPTTGGAAVYGQAVKNAFELAVEEVNAVGDVQFEARFEDDAHDPEKAVTAYGVLKDWGMQVSIGTTTSGPGQAVSPLYKEDNIFALTPSASSLAVIYADTANASNPYGSVFQMCFTDPNQGVASADYLKAHTDLGSKVGVIWKNDDNYSTGVHDKFVAEAKEVGLEVVYDGTFESSTENDFSVQLTQAQAAGADILFLPIYYQPASLILTQANAMNYAPTFFGVDGLDGILSMENFDTSLAEGVYLLTPFSADGTDQMTKHFVDEYQKRYGEVPNQFAADAYDCVYALAQACKAAGITADMTPSQVADALKAEFTKMTFDGITGEQVTWNANGEVSKSPKAVVIKDGVYVGVQD